MWQVLDSDNWTWNSRKTELIKTKCEVGTLQFQRGPSQHEFPFHFPTPEDLPATLEIQNKDDVHSPYFKINYVLEVDVVYNNEIIST